MTLQLRVPDGTFIKLAYRGIVVGVAQTFGGRFYRAMLYAPALRKSGAPEGRRSPLDIETLPFTLHAEDGTDLQPGRTIRLTNLTGGWSTDEANGDAIAIEAFTPIIEDTVDKLTFNVEIENGKYTFQVVDGRINVLAGDDTGCNALDRTVMREGDGALAINGFAQGIHHPAN